MYVDYWGWCDVGGWERKLVQRDILCLARVSELERRLREGREEGEGTEVAELEIQLAEREEEKGSLQLRILELEETISTEVNIYILTTKRVTLLHLDIKCSLIKIRRFIVYRRNLIGYWFSIQSGRRRMNSIRNKTVVGLEKIWWSLGLIRVQNVGEGWGRFKKCIGG